MMRFLHDRILECVCRFPLASLSAEFSEFFSIVRIMKRTKEQRSQKKIHMRRMNNDDKGNGDPLRGQFANIHFFSLSSSFFCELWN